VISSAFETSEAIMGMVAIVLGFALVVVLWWLMVGRPSRDARRSRDNDAGRAP
jgi:hypothetical protein